MSLGLAFLMKTIIQQCCCWSRTFRPPTLQSEADEARLCQNIPHILCPPCVYDGASKYCEKETKTKAICKFKMCISLLNSKAASNSCGPLNRPKAIDLGAPKASDICLVLTIGVRRPCAVQSGYDEWRSEDAFHRCFADFRCQ